jgi:small subunit ribosomal protein S16
MLRIRLRRTGARKQPSYRVVVADSRLARDGAFVEIIGNYDPMTNPETLVIKEERALHWLRQGAQPSETTARLLGKAGILEKFKPVKEKP